MRKDLGTGADGYAQEALKNLHSYYTSVCLRDLCGGCGDENFTAGDAEVRRGEFFRGSRTEQLCRALLFRAEHARKALTSLVQYLDEEERREDTAPYQVSYIGLKSVFGVISLVNCARSFAEFSRSFRWQTSTWVCM
jgi:hypothetical protein